MRFILLALGLLLTTVNTQAQSSSDLKVTGSVFDNGKDAVPYAAINIHRQLDSNLVLVAYTNENGQFDFEVKEGEYFIEVSMFGVSGQKIKLKKTSGLLALDNIFLSSEKSKALNELIVTGEKNQMSLQIDKRVFDVSANLNNQGANATEVLQNIPSVTVDPEGNISLRGSQNVRVLIDGKVSGFASSADALQQLQADMIDKVEVITNASARYEAQGESGIINIVLKKNKKQGFNGSVFLRTGYYPDHGLGVNANYRKEKITLNGSFNVNYREVVGKSSTRQQLETEDTAFIYFQGYKHIRRKYSTSARIDLTYAANAKNTINATVGIRSGFGRNSYFRTYDNYTIQESFLSFNKRDEENNELEDMLEGTLGYTRKFNKPGMEWKTELRGFRDQDFERSNFTETSSLSYGSQPNLEKSNAFITEQSLLLQSDLVVPFSKHGKIETGFRGQMRDIYDDFGYQKLIANEWQSPARFNDQFKYLEKVYAGYVMAANTFNKLGVQAGARVEYSDIFTRQYSLTEGTPRNYFNFFPSLALSYKHSENSTFQLSYSRRINRPGQWNLMPFMKFGDNREMMTGNPDLAPELTGSYEASSLYSWTTGSLLSSVYYRNTKNKFENMTFLGDDGIIYIKAMNIATRHAYGMEFNFNYNPTKWAAIMSGFNFFRETISGSFNNQSFQLDNLSWTNRTTLNITLPQKWRFQLSSNYEAPVLRPQGKRLSLYFMDLGATKDIWKNKATLGVNLTDVFNTRKWRSVTETDQIQSQTTFQWRQRSFRVVFTYRFNQQRKENQNDNIIEGSGGD